jgi:hypothetical protein
VVSIDRLVSYCEEFTDFILVDENRKSIIVNIEQKFFKVIYKRFKAQGFALKHKTLFNEDDNITCVFIKSE